jgi:hypothetical protein
MKLKTMKSIVCMIALALVASCGGSSSSGSDTPAPPATLAQGDIDDSTASNIINCVVDIYNQNIAARAQGAYNNVTVNCPNGGTVLIAGLATKDNNTSLTTTDLTYTMTNCVETRPNHSFTYNGVVTEKGTFNISASPPFVSETIQSTGTVSMSGTITISGFNTATVNQSTTFTINRGYTGASGSIGGRPFTY